MERTTVGARYGRAVAEFAKQLPVTSVALGGSMVPIGLSLSRYCQDGDWFRASGYVIFPLIGVCSVAAAEGYLRHREIMKEKREQWLRADIGDFGFHELLLRQCERDAGVYKAVEEIAQEQGKADEFYKTYEDHRRARVGGQKGRANSN